MKYGDDELGGKHIDHTNIRVSGDEEKARSYIPIARNVLGQLKRDMSFNSLGLGRNQVALEDGTVIKVSSAKGTVDTDQIQIESPKPPVPSGEPIIIFGYIIKGHCVSDSDPDYLQYLTFPVTVGSQVNFDPTSGTLPGNIVFDNYPDYSAKYVSRGTGECDEVLIANYDREFPLLSTTGPTTVGFRACVAADPGQPPVEAGWSWGTYHTCHVKLDISGHSPNYIPLGTAYSFRYVQWDGVTLGNYWPAAYPGGEAGWITDYIWNQVHMQFALWMSDINSLYATYYTEAVTELSSGADDEHFYFPLDKSYWVRKDTEDHGFASNLGFYTPQAGVMTIAERSLTYNGTNVGQGFLYMVNNNQTIRTDQPIIDQNSWNTSSSSGVYNDSIIISAGFEHTSGLQDDCLSASPGLPVNGLRPESIMSTGTTVFGGTTCTPYQITPATFEVGDNNIGYTVPEFTLNCEVVSGYHNVSVKRGILDDAYTCKAEIILFTDHGVRSFMKAVSGFSGYDSTTKITIPVGIPIEEYQLYQI